MLAQILAIELLSELSVEQQEMIVAGTTALDQLYQETNDIVTTLGLTPTQDNNSTSPALSTDSKNNSVVSASQNFLNQSPFKNVLTIPI